MAEQKFENDEDQIRTRDSEILWEELTPLPKGLLTGFNYFIKGLKLTDEAILIHGSGELFIYHVIEDKFKPITKIPGYEIIPGEYFDKNPPVNIQDITGYYVDSDDNDCDKEHRVFIFYWGNGYSKFSEENVYYKIHELRINIKDFSFEWKDVKADYNDNDCNCLEGLQFHTYKQYLYFFYHENLYSKFVPRVIIMNMMTKDIELTEDVDHGTNHFGGLKSIGNGKFFMQGWTKGDDNYKVMLFEHKHEDEHEMVHQDRHGQSKIYGKYIKGLLNSRLVTIEEAKSILFFGGNNGREFRNNICVYNWMDDKWYRKNITVIGCKKGIMRHVFICGEYVYAIGVYDHWKSSKERKGEDKFYRIKLKYILNDIDILHYDTSDDSKVLKIISHWVRRGDDERSWIADLSLLIMQFVCV